MLSARQKAPLLELVNQALERDPDHLAGLRLLVEILWWQRDMDALRAALERMLDSAEAAEMPEDERYALTQLTRLAPDQSQYFERLRELGGPTEPASSETPSDFQIVGDAGSAFGESPPAKSVRQWKSLSGTVSPKRPPIPSASFADLGEIPATVEDAFTGTAPTEPATSEFQEINFETVVAQELPGSALPAESRADANRVALLHQELESVDFYINQGYADIALDTLNLLEGQFGKHPDIDIRRELLQSQPEPAGEVDQLSQPPAPVTAEVVEEVSSQVTPPAVVQAPPAATTRANSKLILGWQKSSKSFARPR